MAPAASRRAVGALAPRDFAVFYRTNAQSRVLEEALRARNIPYTVVGGSASSSAPRSRTCSRTCASSPTPTTHRAPAHHQRAGARHRRHDGRRIAHTPERKISAWQALELGARDEELLGAGPRKKVAASSSS